MKIDQREEINGLEFAVDGGRAAQTRGNIEVSAEEARRPGRIDVCTG